jgi:F0F1-type ATP synthase membrane subunit a
MFFSPLEQFEVILLRPLVLFGDFSITSVTLYLFLVSLLLVVVLFLSFSVSYFIPGHWQSVFELIYEFLFDLWKQTGNFPHGQRFFPLIAAVFFLF